MIMSSSPSPSPSSKKRLCGEAKLNLSFFISNFLIGTQKNVKYRQKIKLLRCPDPHAEVLFNITMNTYSPCDDLKRTTTSFVSSAQTTSALSLKSFSKISCIDKRPSEKQSVKPRVSVMSSRMKQSGLSWNDLPDIQDETLLDSPLNKKPLSEYNSEKKIQTKPSKKFSMRDTDPYGVQSNLIDIMAKKAHQEKTKEIQENQLKMLENQIKQVQSEPESDDNSSVIRMKSDLGESDNCLTISQSTFLTIKINHSM